MFFLCFILAVIIGIGTIHISEFCDVEDIGRFFAGLFVLIIIFSVLLCSASKAVQVISFISMVVSMFVTGAVIIKRDYGHLFR